MSAVSDFETYCRIAVRQGLSPEAMHSIVDKAMIPKDPVVEVEHDGYVLIPRPQLLDRGINDMRGKVT